MWIALPTGAFNSEVTVHIRQGASALDQSSVQQFHVTRHGNLRQAARQLDTAPRGYAGRPNSHGRPLRHSTATKQKYAS